MDLWGREYGERGEHAACVSNCGCPDDVCGLGDCEHVFWREFRECDDQCEWVYGGGILHGQSEYWNWPIECDVYRHVELPVKYLYDLCVDFRGWRFYGVWDRDDHDASISSGERADDLYGVGDCEYFLWREFGQWECVCNGACPGDEWNGVRVYRESVKREWNFNSELPGYDGWKPDVLGVGLWGWREQYNGESESSVSSGERADEL